MSYDRFHKDADRIYRVMSNFTFSDGSIETAWSTPMKLGEPYNQKYRKRNIHCE